jgi:cholesterol oxidase
MTRSEEHFDAVVVGSGFGGSVTTYRLAEAGLSVCLLERGKAYPPNGFARTPHDLGKNFWDPSKGLYGLYNLWSFKGSGALVSSGLGGGSLIYANVLLRKDEKWFKEDLPGGGYREWPITYKDLEPHYENVERMMNAQHYPFGHEPFSETPKFQAWQQAGSDKSVVGMDAKWMPVPLAVSFRAKNVSTPDEDLPENPPIVGSQLNDERRHYHEIIADRRMPRSTCRLCGECDFGCNYGSKNTLDFTYITSAMHQANPPDIRTLCEVKSIKPTGDPERRYTVEYVVHEPDAFGMFKPICVTVTCRYLILAGGTFGTPYLLLRNREAFPGLSSRLGYGYSVNGDLLSFIRNSMQEKNGGSAPRRLDPSFGPVITSAIRFGDSLDRGGADGRGFYIQDGGQPYLASWLAQVSGFPGFLRRSAKFLKLLAKFRLGISNDADLGAEVSDLIGDARACMSSMPMLAMGRDHASGKLFLNGDLLDCDWSIKQSEAYFDRVRRAGRLIAKALKAEYKDNPSYKFNFHQVLTAHPLGGGSMADSIKEGVVDSNCEVFGYPGLFVVDGSAMPGPVGPNPSLTIAAIADRAAERLISKIKPGA